MLSLPYHIILGSQSPRRKDLLASLNISFEIKVLPTEEIYDEHMPPEDVAEYLANLKGQAFDEIIQPNELVITADSVVVLEGKIYEKPSDREHAIRMISELSGKKHTVYTGVSIRTKDRIKSFTDQTDVYLNQLSLDEIIYYVDKYHPFDKAGSYGIQDWIGLAKISKIVGSYPNVMGLPVHQVYETLCTFS